MHYDSSAACMRSVLRDVVQQHELDPDCLLRVEANRGGCLERFDYGRSLRRSE